MRCIVLAGGFEGWYFKWKNTPLSVPVSDVLPLDIRACGGGELVRWCVLVACGFVGRRSRSACAFRAFRSALRNIGSKVESE